MSQARVTGMTPEDFLAWEARQEVKWEFDGFQPVAMAGGTSAHAAIQANVLIALGSRLRGSPCYVRGSDLKVKAGLSYRYPDAFASCTPLPNDATVAEAPTTMFEIVSDSTERIDRIDKLSDYCAIPSVQRYVLLEQDARMATVYARTDAGWLMTRPKNGDVLEMQELGLHVPLAEFYEGLILPDQARPVR